MTVCFSGFISDAIGKNFWKRSVFSRSNPSLFQPCPLHWTSVVTGLKNIQTLMVNRRQKIAGLVHYTVGKSPHIISPILPPLIARGLMETIGNILFISSHIPVHLAPACTVFISRLTRYSIHVYCVFYQDLPFKLRFEKKMFVLYLFCANQACKNAILFDNCKEINEKMCWLFGSFAVLCLFVNFLWNSLWFHLVDKILRVLLVFLKLY